MTTDPDALFAKMREVTQACADILNVAPDLRQVVRHWTDLTRDMQDEASAIKARQRRVCWRAVFNHLRDTGHYEAAQEIEREFMER